MEVILFEKLDKEEFRHITLDDLKAAPGVAKAKPSSTELKEREAIWNLLFKISCQDWKLFPISCVHRDRPDFIIEAAGVSIGIEHTCITHGEHQILDKCLAEAEPGSVVEIPLINPNEKVRSRRELKGQVKSPGSSLHSEPILGLELEENWLAYVRESLESKTEAASDYRRFDRNGLLIQDELAGTGGLIKKEAKRMLETYLAESYWPRADALDIVIVNIGGGYFIEENPEVPSLLQCIGGI